LSSGATPKTLLEGPPGVLLVDGYSGYNIVDEVSTRRRGAACSGIAEGGRPLRFTTIVARSWQVRMKPKRRLSASVDAELLQAAERAARAGRASNVSAWVNDALRLKVQHDDRIRPEAASPGTPAPQAPRGSLRLVLDAGAFLAVERGDREVAALIKGELTDGRIPVTHGGVVAQVWRGGSGRQAPVARLLRGVEVVPLDDELGRRSGMLLSRVRNADATDAAVVLLAADGDRVLTSDPGDIQRLATVAALEIELISV
jgi:hypothetical protein